MSEFFCRRMSGGGQTMLSKRTVFGTNDADRPKGVRSKHRCSCKLTGNQGPCLLLADSAALAPSKGKSETPPATASIRSNAQKQHVGGQTARPQLQPSPARGQLLLL